MTINYRTFYYPPLFLPRPPALGGRAYFHTHPPSSHSRPVATACGVFRCALFVPTSPLFSVVAGGSLTTQKADGVITPPHPYFL